MEIFADVKELSLSSRDGFKLDMNNVCSSPTVITGTEVGINFSQANVLGDHKHNIEQLNYNWYPQFAKSITPSQITIKYDSLLTNFTGIFVKDARFTINSSTNRLKFTGSNVILNNNMVAWSATFDIAPSNPGLVLVDTEQESKKIMSLTDLLLKLKQAGLNVAMQQVINNKVLLYFKKIAK